MRLRPDILIDNIVDFKKYDLNKFNATFKTLTYMYDHMALSNSKIMNTFSDYYWHMKEIYDEDNIQGVASQEAHIPYYLQKYNVETSTTDFGQTWKIIRNIVKN